MLCKQLLKDECALIRVDIISAAVLLVDDEFFPTVPCLISIRIKTVNSLEIVQHRVKKLNDAFIMRLLYFDVSTTYSFL